MKKKITIMKKADISEQEIHQYMDFDSLLSKHKQLRDASRTTRTYQWLLGTGGMLLIGSVLWLIILNAGSQSPQNAEGGENINTTPMVDSATVNTENENDANAKISGAADSTAYRRSQRSSGNRNESNAPEVLNHTEQAAKTSKTFVYVPAEPADGYPSLYHYFETEVKYPEAMKGDSISGVVTIAFTINDRGEPENIVVEESLGELFDAEARRVVQLMPKWKPARYNGSAVASRLSVPITFQILRVRAVEKEN